MLQFRRPGGTPSLEEAAEMFDLSRDEVDEQFGVVPTDPEAGLYTILIDAEAQAKAQARLDARDGDVAEGIFANVRIEPTDVRE